MGQEVNLTARVHLFSPTAIPPMTVVTPFTIPQPSSDPDEAVAGGDRSGPVSCAFDNAQSIIDTSMMKEMVFITINGLCVCPVGCIAWGS